MKIAIIGAGNLGMSIAKGVIQQRGTGKDLIVTRRKLEMLKQEELPEATLTSDNSLAVKQSEVILLAVKPYNIEDVLSEISPDLDPQKHIVVSLATGITLEQMKARVPESVPVFRAMPNIATKIGESITCICHDNGGDANLKKVIDVFDSVGTKAMGDIAGGFSLNFHGIIGLVALILMGVHAVWATIVLIRKNEKMINSFHKFSIFVWLLWLIPFVTGLMLNMM